MALWVAIRRLKSLSVGAFTWSSTNGSSVSVYSKGVLFDLLRILAPRGAAIFVRSLPMKSRKSLARVVLISVILLPPHMPA